MRIFLLSNGFEGGNVYHLSEKEKRYLFSVLRLKVNDVFTAKDKNGQCYKAFLFSEDSMTLEKTDKGEETLLDTLSGYTGKFAQIDAFISVLKNKKNETSVRMLTEIGVRRIILMETDFTEGKLSEHNIERLNLIIREAVQQSGASVPELIGPIAFDEALAIAEGRKIILHQSMRGRTSSLQEATEGAVSISFFIGPEGGFSDMECCKAEDEAALPVLLPTNILRAETAAIYAASSLQCLMNPAVSSSR